MFYRLKQFYKAVFPKIKENEYAWVSEILNHQEFALFIKESPVEQRHAIDVASDIYKKQCLIKTLHGSEQYGNLLKAALLHDCGKSVIKYRLWQRVVIALARPIPKEYKNNLIKRRTSLGRLLLLDSLHPKWGKHLVAKIGMNSNIQTLILNHHSPSNQLEQLLAKFDNKH